MSKVTGKTVKYNQLSFEQYVASQPNNPFAGEMSLMFEYLSKVESPFDQEFTTKLNPTALTFQQWAEQNKDKLVANVLGH